VAWTRFGHLACLFELQVCWMRIYLSCKESVTDILAGLCSVDVADSGWVIKWFYSCWNVRRYFVYRKSLDL